MPDTTVAALITQIHTDGVQVLLALREGMPFGGQWCLPGGHIDPFERADDAVAREVREETGLEFDGRFMTYQDEIIPDQGIHAVVLVFVGSASGTSVAAPGEVSEVRWFALDEARSLPLAFLHNQILDSYSAAIRAAGG